MDLASERRLALVGRGPVAIVSVRASAHEAGGFYQIRIMDSPVAAGAWWRDIDFWLWNGLGWARGRNARSGDWCS